MKQRHFRLTGLAAAALLAVSAAHADNLNLTGTQAYAGDGKLALAFVQPAAVTGTAGLFNVQNLTTGSSFLAYCIEQNQSAGSGSQSYSAAAYAAPTGVQELYDRFYDTSLKTQQGAVAFQLALWQLTGGQSVSSYSLVIDPFTGQSIGAQSLASSWISAVNADNNPFAQHYSLVAWSSASSQDVLQAVPVPEPETYALMLVGLGAIGLVARRRQQSR